MPIDASIPLGIKQPDQMQNLSSLLGVAKGAQELQSGGIALREKQGLQQVMADPSNYTDGDGNIDMAKARQNIMAVAPTTGTAALTNLLGVQKAHTEAVSSLNKIGDDNRTRVANVLSTIPPDADPKLVNQSLDALGKAYGGRIDPWVSLFRQGYQHASQQGPQAVADYFATNTRSVLPQTTQAELNTPNGVSVSDGQTARVVNVKPGVQGMPQGSTVPGTEVKQQLAPGQVESIETDSQGNKHIVTRTTGGAIVGTRPLQGAAPTTPGAAPAPGPFTIPQGETPDTLKLVQGIRANANQAATTVKDQQFNANQIIKLADETSTGKGSQIVASLKGGYAGVPWTSDAASNYNQLGHYMALQTSQLAQSSGLGGTDAAHGIAAEQAGNKEWTADAIKSTARVNRALSTGTDLFNRGVEAAINRTNNPFAAREFQNAWSKTADVDALRLYDSMKNKADDPEGFKKTLHELGGTDSDKYKRTLSKVTEMRKLIKGE